MAVLCAVSFVSSCHKVKEQEKPVKVQETNFTVATNTVSAEYVEVVVRHTGAKDVTWFGFVTEDVTSAEQDLIATQLAQLDKNDLHVGNSQTVAIAGLQETATYRYIAFAVNESGETYGNPGSIVFSTSPKFDVSFAAEVTEVAPSYASFSISHEGNSVLTYTCFVTEDKTTSAAVLAAADYATKVEEGRLAEGVELLSGNTQSVTLNELEGETAYRFIVYGIYDNFGTYIYYGTPADVAFTTPIDLATVAFKAKATNVTNTSADIEVSYNAKAGDLTWYGFLTEDVTTEASSLIASKIAGVTEADWQVGPKTVSLTGLTKDAEYRYIVTGINAQGVYGVSAETKFKAYKYEASYGEYVGVWTMTQGSTVYDFTIEKKVEGQSYTIKGLNGATTAKYGIDTPLVVEGKFVNGELTIACQTISASYVDPYDDGTYKDMFCGMYQSGSSNLVDPTEGQIVAKFILGVDGNIEVTAGKTQEGTEYTAMRFFQVSVSGDDIYAQDSYGTPLPNTAQAPAAASEAYTAWLGTWYIPTIVYQYDSNDEYIGDEVQSLPIVINKEVVNQSYLISGIGPKNVDYSVSAEFVDGKLVVHPQTVYTWQHSTAGEIKELLAGSYGEGDDAMFTWDPSLTIFTGTIGADGKATLTPGQSPSGDSFNAFQFIQYYSSGAYGYGGNYVLPNTMTRTQATSSVPAPSYVGKSAIKSASFVKKQKVAEKFLVK